MLPDELSAITTTPDNKEKTTVIETITKLIDVRQNEPANEEVKMQLAVRE
jgi:hypothetical protein